jgi:hypothetical protein
MNQRKSSTRIGNDERDAAQSALSEHLNAGRLQVNEYAERSAKAADATIASDIAVLFTDLPAPRPPVPGLGPSPMGAMLRNPVVIGAAVLALAGLALVVGFGVGDDPSPRPLPAPPPVPAVTTPPPVTRASTPVPTTAAPVGETVAALPDGVEVRRTTGDAAITLRPAFGVDLDNNTSPNWAVAQTGTVSGHDIRSTSDGNTLYITGDYAAVTGAPEYATCARETAYTAGGLERASLQPGDNICVRTDGNRYALLTVVAAGERAFRFRAVVWDPPIPS